MITLKSKGIRTTRRSDLKGSVLVRMTRIDKHGQKGSALLIVMLVMSALAILGVMSINTSTVELSITRNEREIREVFYLSESAAMEAVQRLIDTPVIDLEDKKLSWHHSRAAARRGEIDFRIPSAWDADGRGEDNAMQSKLGENVFIAAVEYRLASGSSAVCTESRLYLNRAYGLSTRYNAVNLVEMGFYLRY